MDIVTPPVKQAHGYFVLGDDSMVIRLCTSGLYISTDYTTHVHHAHFETHGAATSNYSDDDTNTPPWGRGTVRTHYGHAATGVVHTVSDNMWGSTSREEGCTVSERVTEERSITEKYK